MDSQNVSHFIKNLVYDLDTVRYLIDYGRLKETLPVMDRILENIDSFRADYQKGTSNNIFVEDFWKRRLPANQTLSDIRTSVSHYVHSRSGFLEEDLNKIEYRDFVQNIFWIQKMTFVWIRTLVLIELNLPEAKIKSYILI